MTKNTFEEIVFKGEKRLRLWNSTHTQSVIIDIETWSMARQRYPNCTWAIDKNGVHTSFQRTTVYLHNIVYPDDLRYEQIEPGEDYTRANLRPRTGNNYPNRATRSTKDALPIELDGVVPPLEQARWYPGSRAQFRIISSHPFMKLSRQGLVPKDRAVSPKSTPSKTKREQYDQIALQLAKMDAFMTEYEASKTIVPGVQPTTPLAPSTQSQASNEKAPSTRKSAPIIPLPSMNNCRRFFSEWERDPDAYALWKPRFLALAVDVHVSYPNELPSDMACRHARAKTTVRRILRHPARESGKGYQVGLLQDLHALELEGAIVSQGDNTARTEACTSASTETDLRKLYPEALAFSLLAQLNFSEEDVKRARSEYAELCKTHAQTAEMFRPTTAKTGLPKEWELRARHRLTKDEFEELILEEERSRGISDRFTLLQYVRQKLATDAEVQCFKAHESALWKQYGEENAEVIAGQRAYKWRNDVHYSWGLQCNVAKQRGLLVTIDNATAEAMCVQPCVYCGGFSDERTINSIDRIDSAKSYEPGNCVPCCHRCNWAKNAHTVEEFLQLAANVVAHQRGAIGCFDFERSLYRTTRATMTSYRIGATKRSHEFLLTASEFAGLVNASCNYCGISSAPNHWNGVDRVDSSGDYVPGNVVSACKVCNMMKNKWSIQVFLSHCETINERAAEIRQHIDAFRQGALC